ncbi:5627_t:CDS:1 [Dentiscutata erythropus]|uniref:5627_t:CDS:1 n=1 Tax=Dentiscutata erythropus TaxID=1348616 RepID=A0A9N9PDJ6_9GLOM|nr:5627_t:CDS:1 [Dentiscutata erythropus]
MDERSDSLSKIIESVVPSKMMIQQSYLRERTINSLKEPLSHSIRWFLRKPGTTGNNAQVYPETTVGYGTTTSANRQGFTLICDQDTVKENAIECAVQKALVPIVETL